MKKSLNVQGVKIDYFVRHSPRARRVRLSVNSESGVVLTVPRFISLNRAEQFIQQKSGWILKVLQKMRARPQPKSWVDLGLTKAQAVEKARVLAKAKLEYWNQFYKFKYNRVVIKAPKGRWGSCSRLKNLNFNYKIIFLPEALVDYIVVHELCHLKELNHAARFWDLVAIALPSWKHYRQELKKIAI